MIKHEFNIAKDILKKIDPYYNGEIEADSKNIIIGILSKYTIYEKYKPTELNFFIAFLCRTSIVFFYILTILSSMIDLVYWFITGRKLSNYDRWDRFVDKWEKLIDKSIQKKRV